MIPCWTWQVCQRQIKLLNQAPGKRHDKVQLTVYAYQTLHKCVRLKDKNGLRLIINLCLPCGEPSGRLDILSVDRAERPWNQRLTHSNSKTGSISPSCTHTPFKQLMRTHTFTLTMKCLSWICKNWIEKKDDNLIEHPFIIGKVAAFRIDQHNHTCVYLSTPAND